MSLCPHTKGSDFYYTKGAALPWSVEVTDATATVPDANSDWQLRIIRPDYADDLVITKASAPTLTVVDVTDGVSVAVTLDSAISQTVPRGSKAVLEIADLVNGARPYFWQRLVHDPVGS